MLNSCLGGIPPRTLKHRRQYAKLQKIICAWTFPSTARQVAEYACMLAKAMHASIVAVYAAPTLTQYTGFHVPPNTIDSFVGEIVSGAEKAMTQFVSENFEGVETKAEVVVGYAAEEILETRPRKTPTSSSWAPMDARASTVSCSAPWPSAS